MADDRTKNSGTEDTQDITAGPTRVLDRAAFGRLFDALGRAGYETVGPRLRDGAIVYDTLQSAADLPEGWTERPEAGQYRLERRGDKALFGYTVGPHAWKKYLFLPKETLWRAHRDAAGMRIEPLEPEAPKRAFLGVRACDLEAIRIQDRVFLESGHTDPHYGARRASAFLIAVHCAEPAATCFCTSMGTGPQARGGYDLALTELLADGEHSFLLTPGSDAGESLLEDLALPPASAEQLNRMEAQGAAAAAGMPRRLDTEGLPALLAENPDHPHWDDIAGRCLACANCTMVCPTCFCSTMEDATDLTGETAERRRLWDSCFTAEFSLAGPGPVRATTRARYRQWMTHKLSTWIEQFDTSGCVGCGRCIAWCPVGIDITAEAGALRAALEKGGEP